MWIVYKRKYDFLTLMNIDNWEFAPSNFDLTNANSKTDVFFSHYRYSFELLKDGNSLFSAKSCLVRLFQVCRLIIRPLPGSLW